MKVSEYFYKKHEVKMADLFEIPDHKNLIVRQVLCSYVWLIQLMIRTFNYGFVFQSPKYVDTCHRQAVGMWQFCTFVIVDLQYITIMIIFYKITLKSIKNQHDLYLESIKTSIIGRKLGKFQKA